MALRLAFLLALLLPLPALAQDAFCTALRRLVDAAPGSFAAIPEGEKLFDGALREWRELNVAPHWDFEASFNAILMEHGRTAAQAPATRRYGALLAGIPHCIPGLQIRRQTDVPPQRGIIWRKPGIEIEMLLDRPDRGNTMYQLQLSVMRLR